MPKLTHRFLLVASLLVSLSASAESSLPSSLKSTRTLDGGQTKTVAKWASEQIALLKTGVAQDMKKARTNLIDELSNTLTSPAFRECLSSSITNELLTEDGGIPYQINSLLILGECHTDSAIEITLPYLEAQQPALRYLASKALAKLLNNSVVPSAKNNTELEQSLTTQIQLETLPQTSFEMVSALTKIKSSTQQQSLIQALEGQLANNDQPSDTSYLTLHTGLISLYRSVVTGSKTHENTAPVMRLSYLTLQQLSTLAESENKREQEVRNKLLELSDRILRDNFQRLGSTAQEPSTMNWRSADKITKAWRNILKEKPFSLTDEQLTPATTAKSSAEPEQN